MNPPIRVVILTLSVFTVCAVCVSMVMMDGKGTWPDSWPEELEPYREQASTVSFRSGVIYEIPFKKREEFEKAWPHILKLKSAGAPLILEKSPSEYMSGLGRSKMSAGVRILCPDRFHIEFPDGTQFDAGPPWPNSAKTASGELPEYVVVENGQWVPFTGENDRIGLHRARVDIVLVNDGQIIDLNRLEFPKETPIIDRRFTK